MFRYLEQRAVLRRVNRRFEPFDVGDTKQVMEAVWGFEFCADGTLHIWETQTGHQIKLNAREVKILATFLHRQLPKFPLRDIEIDGWSTWLREFFNPSSRYSEAEASEVGECQANTLGHSSKA